MTNEEATANYKYDRAIITIRRIKTEETHEREVDRHKAFDLAISALEKQTLKKPSKTDKARCIHCSCVVKRDERFCKNCGQALKWSDTK